LHEGGRGAVEEGGLRANAGHVGCEAASGEHCESYRCQLT
jgi:hypothetical protein